MKKILFLLITLLFIFSCTKQIDKQKEQTEIISTSGDSYKKVISGLRGREGVSDIQTLLDEGGVNAQGSNLQTPLMMASEYGYIDLVNTLIKDGAYVNAANSEGLTSLMLASMNGFSDIVDALIKNGAYVDIKDGSGNTSLYFAIERNKADVVDTLLKAKSTIPEDLDDEEFLNNMDVNKDIQDMLTKAPKADIAVI